MPKNLSGAVACLICLGALINPQPSRAETSRSWKKKWIASVAVLAATQALDAHSSRGRYESNPFARGAQGTFNTQRGILVKSAATGGFVSLQLILMKKVPTQNLLRPFAVANTAAAGLLGAMAARNYAVPRTGAATP